MRYKIQLKGKEYVYQLTYRKMKNIRVRIIQGTIQASCPHGTPVSEVERIIKENADAILGAVKSYDAPMELHDGGYIDVFGRRYSLHFIDDGLRNCTIKGDQLIVHDDSTKPLDRYLYKQLLEYIMSCVVKYRQTMSVPFPSVEIKNYKSRWGSCAYEKGRISFNTKLIHIDKDLIEYVVLHELCHFLVHNHSSDFYNEIGKRMPDYEERIRRLKRIHL